MSDASQSPRTEGPKTTMLLVFVSSDVENGDVLGPVGTVKLDGDHAVWGSKTFDSSELDMDEKDAKELKKLISKGDATVMKGVRYVNVEPVVARKIFEGKPSSKEKKGKEKKEKKEKLKGIKKKGKADKLDKADKPKRAKTGYQLFQDEVRAGVAEELKKSAEDTGEVFRNQDVMKKMGEKWKAMTDDEKKVYQDRADELKKTAVVSGEEAAPTSTDAEEEEKPAKVAVKEGAEEAEDSEE